MALRDVSPFFRVFYNNQELSNATDFKYVYSEEEDDECSLTFEFYERESVDLPWLKINAQIQILWGYINGFTSEKRTVYVTDRKPKFAEGELISISITCGEKAISLKQNSNNMVFKQGSILDVMKILADKNQLNAFLEIPTGATNAELEEIFKDDGTYKYFLKLQNLPLDPKSSENHVRINLTSPEGKVILKNTLDSWNTYKQSSSGRDLGGIYQAWRKSNNSINSAPAEKFNFDSSFDVTKPTYSQPLKHMVLSNFKQYDSIPQAGKSDKSIISDLALREQDGPYILDSHDDDITLKKRNFNQRSFKTYEFGTDVDNEFTQFTPESKNRIKSSATNNLNYGGWDRLGKEYYYGNSNLMNSPEVTALAKWQYILNDLQKRDPNATYEIQKVPGKVGGNIYLNRGHEMGDNTVVNIQRVNRITVGQAQQALKDTLDQWGKTIDLAHTDSPQDAFGQAASMNGDSRNHMTPATARFEMNPQIKTGIILTLMGLGKTYSGNYYVIKASHGIDDSGYPYTECELVTDGFNAKEGDSFLPSTSNFKTINRTIGPRPSSKGTKIVRTK